MDDLKGCEGTTLHISQRTKYTIENHQSSSRWTLHHACLHLSFHSPTNTKADAHPRIPLLEVPAVEHRDPLSFAEPPPYSGSLSGWRHIPALYIPNLKYLPKMWGK